MPQIELITLSTVRTILLVEDETTHIELVQRAFESTDYQLITASSISKARKILTSIVPHLLIVDYLLTDGTGFELLHGSIDSAPYPVIIMTSHGSEQIAVEAMKRGAYDYLIKSEHAFFDMPHTAMRALREWEYFVERKSVQARLRLQAAALNSAANGILITDRNGFIEWANPAFSGLTGYSEDGVLGRNPRFLKSDVQDESFYKEMWSTITEGRAWHGELVNRRADGTLYTEEMTITPVVDADGNVLHFIAIKQDVTARKRSEERLQSLSRKLVDAQEAERHRIARELHDQIGQVLTAVKLGIQSLSPLIDSEHQHRLGEQVKVVDQALQQVRSLSLDLRPSLLDDFGLVPALRWYVDRQSRQTNTIFHLSTNTIRERLPSHIEIMSFRVVQEAVTNIIRHAKAQEVNITLAVVSHEVNLTIEDDGVGFEVEAVLAEASRGASMGLLNMQERVLLRGGCFTINSKPRDGTTICVRVPLKKS